MIIRARTVLPISQPPIGNGAIQISRNHIVGVGSWNDLKSPSDEVVDLGDAIVLPGLINAHCHLDYTDMAGMIPAPRSFSSWIKAAIAIKATWSYSEYAQSWLNGAKMLARTGTTTVVDIEAVPELLPEVWTATPLRVCSLLELTGIKSRRSAMEIVSEATQTINTLAHGKCFAGLSPHSLYSTSPGLLKRSAEIAHEKKWLLATHVAESEEEMEMFVRGRGALFDWLKTQRDMSDVGASPVRLLDAQEMLSGNFMAVHANYVSKRDAALLGQHHCSVVHCPRSHEYFGHKKFPLQMLADAGVNICLGTDSLASVRTKPRQPVALDMFSEMQLFAENYGDLPAEKIVQMSTNNGARALSMAGKIGELAPGSFADLIAIPFSNQAEPYENVVQNSTGISAAMMDGTWIIQPH